MIDTILTRRTAHLFDDRPISEELLRAALDCAIRAPNHKLTNPWRFRRIGPESRARIVDLGVSLKVEKNPALGEEAQRKIRNKLESAPVLFVVTQVLVADEFRRREDYASCACAIQNLSIALWSEGVSSKWSSGGVTSHPLTYEIAQVDAAVEEIIGFVWIGYAELQPETPRLPVDEVLTSIP